MGCRVRKCRWNACSVHISEIQHVTFGRGFLSEKSLKKVQKKFGEELKSRTFALPLKNGRAARPGVLEKTDAERFSKKVPKRFGSLKIMRTFAAPFEKRVLGRGFEKFIEKTDLLYKKQVPRKTIYREASILLRKD